MGDCFSLCDPFAPSPFPNHNAIRQEGKLYFDTSCVGLWFWGGGKALEKKIF